MQKQIQKKTISAVVDTDLWEQLEQVAIEQNRSKSNMLAKILREYFGSDKRTSI